MHTPSQHPLSDDRLFRQIVEDEVSVLAAHLTEDAKIACVWEVLETVGNEARVCLKQSKLTPEGLTGLIRREIGRFSGK